MPAASARTRLTTRLLGAKECRSSAMPMGASEGEGVGLTTEQPETPALLSLAGRRRFLYGGLLAGAPVDSDRPQGDAAPLRGRRGDCVESAVAACGRRAWQVRSPRASNQAQQSRASG